MYISAITHCANCDCEGYISIATCGVCVCVCVNISLINGCLLIVSIQVFGVIEYNYI